jgi:DNA-directed RNA polymerase specialized sigma24 family protein
MVRSTLAMAEGDGGPRERARAAVQSEGVRFKLFRIAMWRTRSPAESEDLVQSALVRVLDPEASPWNPDGAISFVAHVGSVINSLAANAARSFHSHRVVIDADRAGDEGAADGAPLADEAISEHEERARLARLGGELRALLEARDPEAARVYTAILEGIEGHAAIAAHAQCTPRAVRYAYDRIAYHAERIRDRDDEAERARAKDRRPKQAKRAAADAKDVTKEGAS